MQVLLKLFFTNNYTTMEATELIHCNHVVIHHLICQRNIHAYRTVCPICLIILLSYLH